jgi:CRISPR-associated protein Cmr3
MMNWYKITPIDTLFFRDAKPMRKGEDHEASCLFPPSPETFTGAFRTSVLKQNKINIQEYYKENCDSQIIDSIGKAGSSAPFNVIGPLFFSNDSVFLPCPYSWFYEVFEKTSNNKFKVNIIKSFFLNDKTKKLFKSNKNITYWAKGTSSNIKSLGSYWISLDDFYKDDNEKTVFSNKYFFDFEKRTGIALNNNRTVREHHLYSFNHLRLKEGVGFIVGIDKNLPIKDKGCLLLGAEQKMVKYEKIILKDFSSINNQNNNKYMLLGTQKIEDLSINDIVATGKIKNFSGWDMKKKFYKPTSYYYPAGSVFSKKINENLIEI